MEGQYTDTIKEATRKLFAVLGEYRARLSTAESCTGGLLGTVLTDFSGSSEFYEGGVITYSNALKQNLLGISPKLLENHGAVSREVVLAMAKSVASKLGTKYSIATTGIAGPGGGTKDKPVGTIWCGFQVGENTFSELYKLSGDRQDNRAQTVLLAIVKLTQLIKEGHS